MQISRTLLAVLLAGAAAWPTYSQSATPEQQTRALELLRQTISQQHQAAAAPGKPAPQQHAAPAAPAAPAKPSSASTAVTSKPAPKASPAKPAPAAPQQPAGPKTKQQKLQDLLNAYRADKISPPEYQAERAKILAEP